MLGNMEKAPVETDASNVTKDDVSHKATQQDDDPKPDYSSKATTKTKLTADLHLFYSGRSAPSGRSLSHG
jgi:ATP-binding cassette subfamily B (MDR/TAP) protein 1